MTKPISKAYDIDPRLESRRQAYLEHLYERSGRTCCTYTGLYQEHVSALVERDMAGDATAARKKATNE